MQKIAIITKSDQNVGANQLAEAVKLLGLEVHSIYAQNPDIKALLSCDQVIARATTETLADVAQLLKICEENGIPTSPSSQHILDGFNKCRTYIPLDAKRIAQPKSVVFLPNRQISNIPFLPPYVIKPALGNRGSGVEKCASLNEVRLISKKEIYQKDGFIVQKFIEANGSDKRIFVIGSTVVAAMKRTSSSDDFRSNLAVGGTAENYQWTKQEAALAILATKTLGLDFAGVDIIDSPKGPLVLEVNPSPGFKVGEYANINIAKQIVEYLVQPNKG